MSKSHKEALETSSTKESLNKLSIHRGESSGIVVFVRNFFVFSRAIDIMWIVAFFSSTIDPLKLLSSNRQIY